MMKQESNSRCLKKMKYLYSSRSNNLLAQSKRHFLLQILAILLIRKDPKNMANVSKNNLANITPISYKTKSTNQQYKKQIITLTETPTETPPSYTQSFLKSKGCSVFLCCDHCILAQNKITKWRKSQAAHRTLLPTVLRFCTPA